MSTGDHLDVIGHVRRATSRKAPRCHPDVEMFMEKEGIEWRDFGMGPAPAQNVHSCIQTGLAKHDQAYPIVGDYSLLDLALQHVRAHLGNRLGNLYVDEYSPADWRNVLDYTSGASLNASSGYLGAKFGAPTKRQFYEKCPEIIDVYRDRLRQGYVCDMSSLESKVEIRDLYEATEKKLKPARMFNPLGVCQITLNRNLSLSFSDRLCHIGRVDPWSTRMLLGTCFEYGGFHRVFWSMAKKRIWYFDVKRMDSSFSMYICYMISLIRSDFVDPDYLVEFWRLERARWGRPAADMSDVQAACVTVAVYYLACGNPSGSDTTSIDASLLMRLIFTVAYFIKHRGFEGLYDLDWFGTGDDFFIEENAELSPAFIADTFLSFGFEAQYDYLDWRPFEELKFLGRSPFWLGNILVYKLCSVDKAYASLLWCLKGNISHELLHDRLQGLYRVYWTHEAYRKFVQRFVLWMNDRYDLRWVLPTDAAIQIWLVGYQSSGGYKMANRQVRRGGANRREVPIKGPSMVTERRTVAGPRTQGQVPNSIVDYMKTISKPRLAQREGCSTGIPGTIEPVQIITKSIIVDGVTTTAGFGGVMVYIDRLACNDQDSVFTTSAAYAGAPSWNPLATGWTPHTMVGMPFSSLQFDKNLGSMSYTVVAFEMEFFVDDVEFNRGGTILAFQRPNLNNGAEGTDSITALGSQWYHFTSMNEKATASRSWMPAAKPSFKARQWDLSGPTNQCVYRSNGSPTPDGLYPSMGFLIRHALPTIPPPSGFPFRVAVTATIQVQGTLATNRIYMNPSVEGRNAAVHAHRSFWSDLNERADREHPDRLQVNDNLLRIHSSNPHHDGIMPRLIRGLGRTVKESLPHVAHKAMEFISSHPVLEGMAAGAFLL